MKIELKLIFAMAILSLSNYSGDAVAADTVTQAPNHSDKQTTQINTDNLKPDKASMDIINSLGVSYTLSGNNLDIVIDEKKSIDSMPLFMTKEEMENMNYTRAIPIAPVGVLIYGSGTNFMLKIMQYVYVTNDKIDNLHITNYVIPRGSNQKQACYTFNYTRNQFDVNIKNRIPYTLPFIRHMAPGLTYETWCKSLPYFSMFPQPYN